MLVATPTGWIFVRFIFCICWHIAIWVGANRQLRQAVLSLRFELRLKTELSIKHDLL